MKKKFFAVLAALCATFLFTACSDSPSEVVEKHFDKLQNMTVEEVKAAIQADADRVYQEKYNLYWKQKNENDEFVYNEEEAKELAAADKERFLSEYTHWDEDSYAREARKRSEIYAFAKMEIKSESISGNTATVKTVITYRDGSQEDREFKLKKDDAGDWVIQFDDAKEEDAKEEGNAE